MSHFKTRYNTSPWTAHTNNNPEPYLQQCQNQHELLVPHKQQHRRCNHDATQPNQDITNHHDLSEPQELQHKRLHHNLYPSADTNTNTNTNIITNIKTS